MHRVVLLSTLSGEYVFNSQFCSVGYSLKQMFQNVYFYGDWEMEKKIITPTAVGMIQALEFELSIALSSA